MPLICAKFGIDLFNISKVIGRKTKWPRFSAYPVRNWKSFNENLSSVSLTVMVSRGQKIIITSDLRRVHGWPWHCLVESRSRSITGWFMCRFTVLTQFAIVCALSASSQLIHATRPSFMLSQVQRKLPCGWRAIRRQWRRNKSSAKRETASISVQMEHIYHWRQCRGVEAWTSDVGYGQLVSSGHRDT